MRGLIREGKSDAEIKRILQECQQKARDLLANPAHPYTQLLREARAEVGRLSKMAIDAGLHKALVSRTDETELRRADADRRRPLLLLDATDEHFSDD